MTTNFHSSTQPGSCGLMDKAPDFGSGDCRFESCHDRKYSFYIPFYISTFHDVSDNKHKRQSKNYDDARDNHEHAGEVGKAGVINSSEQWTRDEGHESTQQ